MSYFLSKPFQTYFREQVIVGKLKEMLTKTERGWKQTKIQTEILKGHEEG